MPKENDCTKCPAYYFHRDYWGECDEYCMIRDYKYFSNGCRLPMFIRRILWWKHLLNDLVAFKRMEWQHCKEMRDWKPED